MARRSQPGRLRHRVELQENVHSETESGQLEDGFVTRATVYADVRPLRGYEAFGSHQLQAEVSHRIRIRWTPTLAPEPSWRVLYGSRVFRIESVYNVDERDRLLDLVCTEEV